MSKSKHPFLAGLDGPVVLAHRGGRNDRYPENTQPVFEAAVISGAQILETDLHATRDGVLIASHDAKVDGLNIPLAKAAEVAEHQKDGIELYPRFDDLLDSLPGTIRWNIDPKSMKAADLLCSLIYRKPELLKRICVGAFFDGRIKMLRRQFGESLCTSMGPREAAIFLATGRTKANVAQLPLHLFGRQIATERVVRLCQEADIDLHLWTLNTPEEIDLALNLGANGIVTDEVELAVQMISEKTGNTL